MSLSVVVSSKGQIVIPAALRKKFRIKEGMTISFREEEGRLVIEPDPFSALQALKGTLPDYPFEKDLEEERRAARLHEESR
ncbi:MAG TPA: AbrB/MazE/SpoVT family DNA-binding domain-containing protein [Silvibacterium sp.]|nr:AbrB/MazE/SpoVT family DNA-binding domain-containing protein [Silvibacterium sp.]